MPLEIGAETEMAAPYASLVTVATDQAGVPLLLLSSLATHTRAVMSDPRVALLVVDPAAGSANPQEDDRVTLMGRLDREPDPGRRARFLARHPYASTYADFADFSLWRMTVTRAHRVSGFGAAAWMDDPSTFAVDAPLATALDAAEPALIADLSNHHPGLADRIAGLYLGGKGEGWRLVALDADGVDVAPPPGSESPGRVHRVPFSTPLTAVADAASAVLTLSGAPPP